MPQIRRKHKIFGRPALAEKERRSVKIAVFFNIEEAEMLKEKCAETYLTLPEFLRRASLSRQIEKRKSDFDLEALTELRRCGHNFNQLARELSAARKMNLEIDFEKVEKVFQKQMTILNKLNRKIIGE